MDEFTLQSVTFTQLKGLENVEFVFEKRLTAIMGVNGVGKTTVIHALACAYQPPVSGKGENHKFPEFFVPNTDSLWAGSVFLVVNKKEKSSFGRKYEKKTDRWTPRYEDRPRKNVYYIGIDSCLPEIEKNSLQSRISYSSSQRTDKISERVIHAAAVVLNKDYSCLLDNAFKNKHFIGVELGSGLKYSSLSMGTGEQRIIKIFETVMNAEPYSLILIDEIDLLLHVSSLKRLIVQLADLADRKNLQIIFTTHSLEMVNMTDYVGIQYLSSVKYEEGKEAMFVYDRISSDLIYNLTGDADRDIKIYVEDEMAKAVIKKVLRVLGASGRAEVIKYGAIENAFTLAAAKVLSGEDTANTLIVLDGDKYRNDDDKMAQIKKKLSGTEDDAENKRLQALSLLAQFNLPEGVAPEKFFHSLLLENGDKQSELTRAAAEINAVHNTHEWLYGIRKKLNDSEENIVRDIIDISLCSEQWEDYIYSVKTWLASRVDV